MPAVRITRSSTNGSKNAPPTDGADTATVAPEDAAAIRASASGPEQSPSQQQQAIFANWRQVADTLGDPYSVELIPVSKLRMMRRDPIIGFGLSFIKTPHIRAKWFIDAKDANGPNAQIAAHLDHDLRQIYASFVLQWCNSLDFGFQALARRFQFQIPSGTYLAPDAKGDLSEQPIWNQGSIQPLSWKPFVALPPETVEPLWAPDGSFFGIDYDGTAAQGGGASGSANAPPSGTGAKKKNDDKFEIDLNHALWITNEKDQNFGSIFGYPRLGYAYRYWWSYWFRWAIADRAFEKKADPSILIYHPEGKFTDPSTGAEIAYADYALQMGTRMRSGGVITLPSTPYEGPNGPTNIREWEIDSTQDMMNFDPFDKSFDYLDIGKIRSLWIPEQSLVEGKGGTSSRNVAAEFDSSFTESQAVMSAQITETINRWIIPQWLAINYPEFIQNNGTAKIVIQGFADEDVQFTQQVIQLIGQQQTGINKLLTLVDLPKVLDDAGVPILDPLAQKKAQSDLIAQLQAGQPPGVAPVSGPGGRVGVVPSNSAGQQPAPQDPNAPAPSSTGFSMQYIQPREVIYLSRDEVYGAEENKITIETADPGEGVIARFDPDKMKIFISADASQEQVSEYVMAIGDALARE